MFRRTYRSTVPPRETGYHKFRKYASLRNKKFAKRYFTAVLGIGAAEAVYLSVPEKDRRHLNNTLGGAKRFLRSSAIGTAVSFDYWWTLRNVDESNLEYFRILEDIHQRSATRILRGCLKNGGLYIKLGQGLANLDHVLPKEYTQTLKVLQDRCLTRKPGEVLELFEADFGCSYKSLFESFDEEPIAAASLAQVFKAKTKSGDTVAVKIQYIDLRDRFVGDMATLKFLLGVAGKFFPKFDFAFLLHELHDPLQQELDFLNEAKNAERCSRDLRQFSFVHVPKVYWDLSTQRILTTEFIDGVKISDTETLLNQGFSLADIDRKLFTLFSEQIFHTGFVHADPHPGNVLVRKGRDGTAQLVLLDHGLYETLPDENRIPLTKLWRAIIYNDHAQMKKYCKQLGVSEQEYRLFCIALSQRYVPPEKEGDGFDIMKLIFDFHRLRQGNKNLTKEEKQRIMAEFAKLQDRIIEVFKTIPSKLYLVTRNLNAVRSVARIHGNPVDRHKIMAECATKHMFIPKDNSFVSKFKAQKDKCFFYLLLWWDSVKRLFLSYFSKMPIA